MVARTEQTGAVEPVELDLSRMIGHL
ncbi:MAG: hypothetical protein QOH45_2905, partial [Pseudonocardiales bacterium]|nr:hypothetical protein [Pseudonocardiales bacterium]